MGNTYAHEKPSDLEVERARLKSVIHGILISSITQRIFPLQSTSQGPFRPGSLVCHQWQHERILCLIYHL